MFDILKNSKNTFIFQLSGFLVFVSFNAFSLLLNILFQINTKIVFNFVLVALVYIYLYKKLELQVDVLIFLTNKPILKYYRITKKLYPFTKISVFYIYITILYLFRLLAPYFDSTLSIYILNVGTFYFYFVIIFLFFYESLFYSNNSKLFYDYLESILSENKNKESCEKIRVKIFYLLENFVAKM